MTEPVLCPIHPDLVRQLKEPSGLEYTGRFRLRVQDDGVLVFEAVHDCFLMRCDHYDEIDSAQIDGSGDSKGKGGSVAG